MRGVSEERDSRVDGLSGPRAEPRPSLVVVKSATCPGGKETHLLAEFSRYLGYLSSPAPLPDQSLKAGLPYPSCSSEQSLSERCNLHMTTGSKWLSTGASGRESEDWLDALMVQGRGLGLLGPGVCEKWPWSSGSQLVCTSGYLQILHPLKQWPAQVSVITPASLS